MSDLLAYVRGAIERERLAQPGDLLVVGVSGGPDSLCLLHLLRALGAELGLGLHVAHLDHMIRSDESAGEAHYVAELARAWGLPATVEQADVPALARERRLNLHAAARAARYAFLARVAQAQGARAVAVAHHANDQAETVLLHLLRGAGSEGLRGMRPAVEWQEWAAAGDDRGSRIEDSGAQLVSAILDPRSSIPVPARLIRPLLGAERAAIEAYCAEQGLAPRQDPSNDDLAATRNRIRHDLLPRLIEYNPHIVAALGRTAAISADEHDALAAALADAWPRLAEERADGISFGGHAWRELHPALQRAALRRAYARFGTGATLGFEHAEQARALAAGGVGRRLELPGGVALEVGYGGSLSLGAPPPADAPQLPGELAALPEQGALALAGGWSIVVARGPAGAGEPGPWRLRIDAGRLDGPLLARRRRPGDRLSLGAPGHKRVQDIFVDAKVPRALRAAWPLIGTPAALVWVAGLRADPAFLAGPQTQDLIEIRVTSGLLSTPPPSPLPACGEGE